MKAIAFALIVFGQLASAALPTRAELRARAEKFCVNSTVQRWSSEMHMNSQRHSTVYVVVKCGNGRDGKLLVKLNKKAHVWTPADEQMDDEQYAVTPGNPQEGDDPVSGLPPTTPVSR